MRLFLLAAVTILMCWHALAAQTSWAPPASVKWPLLDFGIRGDSANGVSLLAMPNSLSRQGFELQDFRLVHASTAVLRRWLAVAKYLVDSGASRLPLLPLIEPLLFMQRSLVLCLDLGSCWAIVFAPRPIQADVRVVFGEACHIATVTE